MKSPLYPLTMASCAEHDNWQTCTCQMRAFRAQGRAATNCTTCFGGFKHKSEIISITKGDYTENSSDLSSGRRPTSKSDEFFISNPKFLEILRCENIRFSVHTYNLSEHDSAASAGRQATATERPDSKAGFHSNLPCCPDTS